MPGKPGIFFSSPSPDRHVQRDHRFDLIRRLSRKMSCLRRFGGEQFDGIACSPCWSATRMFVGGEPRCSKCGNLLEASRNGSADLCHQCDEHHYDQAESLGVYERALAATILQLKKAPVIPQRIESALSAFIERTRFANADLVIPVPLSARRRIERGFNQAEIIAERISKITNIPIDSHSLVRKVHTPVHRAGMDRKARELTVKNAFEVLRPKLVEGRSVLLVDDIFTSGATVSYAAKALKNNGAARVNVFALSRAQTNR